MKIFAIRDEEMRPVRDLAYLIYFERQKQFYIEIPDEIEPWDLPMILFDFAEKGIRTLDAKWSKIWVAQRIVPPDRQNLGQILRDNGLLEYDEYRLLLLAHGRCAQDSCYIAEVREKDLPSSVTARRKYKVNAALPLQNGRMIVFFADSDACYCEINNVAKDKRTFRRLLSYYEEFRRVKILPGGYGIGWESGQTLSDRALYTKGTRIPVTLDDFRTSLAASLVDADEAAGLLGCTRQYIHLLVKKGRLQPLLQSEKSTIFLRPDVQRL